MQVTSWMVRRAGEPMDRETRQEHAAPGEVIIEVAGCGVCHTDFSYVYDGVPTRHPFPLTLGHEVSGIVVEADPTVEDWVGKSVIVPAVIPCNECEACRAGRGSICPHQIFPGNDVHGGFGTHLRVPAKGLCPVPDLSDAKENPNHLHLESLSVIADAVSTPYQAILRSGLSSGDLAVFVGVGGVGGFGVQIASALGADVIGIDVDQERLNQLEAYGLSLGLPSDEMSFRDLRKAVRGYAKEKGIASWRQKIFETSGTADGQTTAFGLVGPGGFLSVVGFTPAKLEIRLSNLMAYDATARGNWGCLPEHYPAIVELVLSGKVAIEPFVQTRPLRTINDVFQEVREGKLRGRVILIP